MSNYLTQFSATTADDIAGLHISQSSSLKSLKEFVARFGIEVTGHKGKKQSYHDAIMAWRTANEAKAHSEAIEQQPPVTAIKRIKRKWRHFPGAIVANHEEYKKRYRLSADDSDRCSRHPIGGFSISREKRVAKNLNRINVTGKGFAKVN